jgi:light-regulated signal transduction histidine kinase (bacteriophytochrome)
MHTSIPMERPSTEDALARAREEFEQFVYAAGHDLQESLRAVTSFTQLLAREAKGRLGGDADQYIAFILEGTARMRAMVDGLLALSRVASAESPMRRVDSGQIVAQCIAETGTAVEVAELPEVTGDAAQLKLVFQNLLANAIRFQRLGVAPCIEISATKSGAEWRFCVRDNGTGFNAAQAQNLFVPFRRLHSREVSGVGIGLAVCRKIVERHGGRIWAEAVEGEGAAFWFTLPAGEGQLS